MNPCIETQQRRDDHTAPVQQRSCTATQTLSLARQPPPTLRAATTPDTHADAPRCVFSPDLSMAARRNEADEACQVMRQRHKHNNSSTISYNNCSSTHECARTRRRSGCCPKQYALDTYTFQCECSVAPATSNIRIASLHMDGKHRPMLRNKLSRQDLRAVSQE